MYIIIQLFLGLLSMHCVISFSTKCFLKDDFEKCIKEKQAQDGMKKFSLSDDKSATCNDGTKPGYFVRRNASSSQWIIYLEGGWFCHDKKSCTMRMRMVSVTSSKFLPEKRIGTGLLSIDQNQNPEFWQANHVYIPYCSSDFWVGNTNQRTMIGSIAFHGSRIITSVVKELLNVGLKDASQLILAGSSAGGIGVLQNIDRISSMMESHAEGVKLRGIVDSAWFLDAGKKEDCKPNNIHDCSPNIVFKEAVKFWGADVHSSCDKKFQSEKHKCLFAPNTIPFVKTPVFIFQWLQDTVQMLADNAELKTRPGLMFTSKYRAYGKRLNRRMKTSLKKVSRKHGIFAPSCISHTGLAITTSLNGLTLKGKTFHDALRCWMTEKKISKCRRRVVDDCTGVSCNGKCPTIYHPLTGQEIRRPEEQKIPRDQAKYYLELLSQVFSWEELKQEKLKSKK